MSIQLDDRELAAVLAGLRLLQQSLERGNGLPHEIEQICAAAGAGLTSQEINRLCQRINVADNASPRP
jgi:hypothetical protein